MAFRAAWAVPAPTPTAAAPTMAARAPGASISSYAHTASASRPYAAIVRTPRRAWSATVWASAVWAATAPAVRDAAAPWAAMPTATRGMADMTTRAMRGPAWRARAKEMAMMARVYGVCVGVGACLIFFGRGG